MDTAALAVTSLGGWIAALVMMAGLMLFLLVRGRRVDALVVLVSGVPMLFGLLSEGACGSGQA